VGRVGPGGLPPFGGAGVRNPNVSPIISAAKATITHTEDRINALLSDIPIVNL